jgi:hypothetical protein
MKRSAGDIHEEEGGRRNVKSRSYKTKNDIERPTGEMLQSHQTLRPQEGIAMGKGREAERLALILRAEADPPQSGTVPQSLGEVLRRLSPAASAPTVEQNGIHTLLRLQFQQQLLANQQQSPLSQLINLRQRQELDSASLSSMLSFQDRTIGSSAPAPPCAALSFEHQLLALQRERNLQAAQQYAALGGTLLPDRGLSSLGQFANQFLLGASSASMGNLPSPFGSLAHQLQQVPQGVASFRPGNSSVVPVSQVTSTSWRERASIEPAKASAPSSQAMGQHTADSSISDATITSRKSLTKAAQRKQGEVSVAAAPEHAADQTPTKRKKRPYRHESFPVKLHRLIREAEATDKTHIISFNDEGTEFNVHKSAAFEEEILHDYFRHNKLSSFRRLLNMYGFVRLQDGAEGGTFRHPSFLKDKPELCQDLERVR